MLTDSDLLFQLEKELRYLAGNQQYLLLEKEGTDFEIELLKEPETVKVSEPDTLVHEEPVSMPVPEEGKQALPIEESRNLDSLRIRIHNCEKCDLSIDRKSIVFGQGNRKSDILFIGEAPGEDEDRQGQPFVGRAGQLLTQIIHSIGLNRESVYITNTVKCRPPGNRNPKSEELVACSPILNKQIHLLDPRLIVTLGNVATHQLIPEAPGIMTARGSLYAYMGIPVLPAFHPSYLLRNPSALNLMWEDMRRIRQFIFRLQNPASESK